VSLHVNVVIFWMAALNTGEMPQDRWCEDAVVHGSVGLALVVEVRVSVFFAHVEGAVPVEADAVGDGGHGGFGCCGCEEVQRCCCASGQEFYLDWHTRKDASTSKALCTCSCSGPDVPLWPSLADSLTTCPGGCIAFGLLCSGQRLAGGFHRRVDRNVFVSNFIHETLLGPGEFDTMLLVVLLDSCLQGMYGRSR